MMHAFTRFIDQFEPPKIKFHRTHCAICLNDWTITLLTEFVPIGYALIYKPNVSPSVLWCLNFKWWPHVAWIIGLSLRIWVSSHALDQLNALNNPVHQFTAVGKLSYPADPYSNWNLAWNIRNTITVTPAFTDTLK